MPSRTPPKPRTPPSVIAPTAAAPPVPTLSFEDAIKQYQSQYPSATRDLYTGLFPYLEGQGYQVERPTHAGGTLPSDDKIVDKTTGQVYDVISDVNAETGSGRWVLGTAGYWVNGAPSATPPPPGSTPTAPSAPTPAATPPPTLTGPGHDSSRTPPKPHAPPVGGPGHDTSRTAPGGQGPVPGSTSSLNRVPNPYAAAWDAARRRRGMAGAGGRRSTIIGGFGGGTPLTRPAMILGRTR